MNVNMFREYDIRGIVPEDINEETSYTIGKSFASYIKNKDVIIGHDNRLSSPMIHDNLIKGLLECGANIIDLGICTTPMYYIIKKHLNIENGIMITASHNPKEYNGFKISFDIIGAAYGDKIYDFRDFTLKGNFTETQGSITDYPDKEKVYLEKVKQSVNLGDKKIKVVIDTANGTGSVFVKKIFEMFDIDMTYINDISDGSFPVHHPDPSVKENMMQLSDIVKNGDYDLGIGIDGDADRVGIVDNNGEIISNDILMILIYKALYPTMKNKKAIMDVKCSKAVIDEMNKINLPLTIYRTGNSYLNYMISTENYDFGGEFSGHFFFNDKWPGVDDGMYAALRIIEILSKTDFKLSDMLKNIPKYVNTPEIKLDVPDTIKTEVINRFKKYLDNKNIKYNDIDGVRIDLDDGFILVRQSNTGPNLTLRFEKQNEEELEKIKNEYLDIINQIMKEI